MSSEARLPGKAVPRESSPGPDFEASPVTPTARISSPCSPLPPATSPVVAAPATPAVAKTGKGKGKGKGPGPPPPPGKPKTAASSPSKSPREGALVLPPAPLKGKQGKAAGKGGPPPPKGAPPAKAGVAKAAAKSIATSASKGPFHKKLYWKQLDIGDAEGTIFSGDPSNPSSDSTAIDFKAFSRMFEAEKKKGTQEATRSSGVLSKAQQRNTGTKLLSDHRARNIAIVLKKMPMPTKDLAVILRSLEWEASNISTDDLEQMLEVIPTQEEAAKLKDYSSAEAREKLRDVEQMVLPLACLSRGTARVRLLCIARSARAQFKSASRTLASIRSACSAIQKSGMLREVMQLALQLGNFINHGDSKKGAKAITVGSLMALRDFKAGGMSSLHFLCASLLRKDQERDAAEALARELRPAERIAKLQVQTLQGTLRSFQRDLETVNAECQNFLQEYSSSERRSMDGSPSPHGKEEEDEDRDALEEAEAAAEAAAVTEDCFSLREDADATRWVEDVMKVRGSARKRLRCMRHVIDKLGKLLKEDVESTAEQAHSTLRFCGMPVPKAGKEVPVDLESLLGNISEFTKVFKVHWEEVKKDLPHYQKLFGEHGGDSPSPERPN